MLISQVLTKESAEDFTDRELFPVESILYSDRMKTGAYGDVRIVMKSGDEKRICFDEMRV